MRPTPTLASHGFPRRVRADGESLPVYHGRVFSTSFPLQGNLHLHTKRANIYCSNGIKGYDRNARNHGQEGLILVKKPDKQGRKHNSRDSRNKKTDMQDRKPHAHVWGEALDVGLEPSQGVKIKKKKMFSHKKT